MRLDLQELPPEVRGFLEPITFWGAPDRQGMTSRVALGDAAPGPVAVKRCSGRHLEGVRREHHVLRTLAPLGLPVPQPLLYAERDEPGGVAGWLVTRRLPGEPLSRSLLSEPDPSRRQALARHLGETLAHVHAVPASASLEVPGGDWVGWMLERSAILGPQLEPARLEWLRAVGPSPVAQTLVHGDLFLDNAVAERGQVAGLIDWAFGAIGDPRYDIALASHELTPPQREAFLEGYGGAARLSEEERAYFVALGLLF